MPIQWRKCACAQVREKRVWVAEAHRQGEEGESQLLLLLPRRRQKIDGPADAAAVVVVVDVDVGHCPPFGGNGGTLILFFISLLFPQN